jgi:hypothetical protein
MLTCTTSHPEGTPGGDTSKTGVVKVLANGMDIFLTLKNGGIFDTKILRYCSRAARGLELYPCAGTPIDTPKFLVYPTPRLARGLPVL